jgi:hypothetical protein
VQAVIEISDQLIGLNGDTPSLQAIMDGFFEHGLLPESLLGGDAFRKLNIRDGQANRHRPGGIGFRLFHE